MLVFIFTWASFEVSEETFDVLNVGFGGGPFRFVLQAVVGKIILLHRAFIHIDDNYINQQTSSFA